MLSSRRGLDPSWMTAEAIGMVTGLEIHRREVVLA